MHIAVNRSETEKERNLKNVREGIHDIPHLKPPQAVAADGIEFDEEEWQNENNGERQKERGLHFEESSARTVIVKTLIHVALLKTVCIISNLIKWDKVRCT